MPQPFAAQPNTNAYIGGAAIFEEPIPPGVNVHQPSSQIAVATRQLTMEDKPPGMPAYVSLPQTNPLEHGGSHIAD
jgi:hypothetical protein